ncbi:MAG: CopG family transcriptional regulator [Clostridia bacterium]|nr:CopG family transcriptional regulator [Clostridia bacterium]
MDTEKITINIGAMDLGNIDLLVEQCFYTNRSDFIRTAIRNQINAHSNELKKITSDMSVFGMARFNRKELEKMYEIGKKLNLKLIGMLVVDNDVPVELFKKTMESVKVYGIINAPAEIRKLVIQKQDE